MINKLLQKIVDRIVLGSKKYRMRKKEFEQKFDLGMALYKDKIMSKEQFKNYLEHEGGGTWFLLPNGHVVCSEEEYFRYKLEGRF